MGALTAESERVRNLDSLADTKWSRLFHEARTCDGSVQSVSIAVRVRGGAVEVGIPLRTRQGETHHVRNETRWDGTVSIQARPFMSTDCATKAISDELRGLAQAVAAKQAPEP